MKFHQVFATILAGAVTLTTQAAVQTRAAGTTPKILLCSDSTTANYVYDAKKPLQGWGYYLHNFTTIPVLNLAENGRSLRTYISLGLWANLLSHTAPGDYVVIEMGHNDDRDPTTDKDNKGVLPGLGEETVIGLNKEVVHTFGWYMRKMIADVKAKQAIPIISGMVPRNYWKGNTLQKDWPFANYAAAAAAAAGLEYLNHTTYSVALFQSFGPTKAKTYFPLDNTHTGWAGALLNTQTFITAIKCKSPTSQLAQYLNPAGKAISQHC